MKAIKVNSIPSGYDNDEQNNGFSKSYAKFKPLNTLVSSKSIESEEYNLTGYDSDEEKYGFSKNHSKFSNYTKPMKNPKSTNKSLKNYKGHNTKLYSSFETFENIPEGYDKFDKYADYIKPKNNNNNKPVNDSLVNDNVIEGTDKDEQKHGFSRIFANVKNALGFK
jgi:hypothetical protein